MNSILISVRQSYLAEISLVSGNSEPLGWEEYKHKLLMHGSQEKSDYLLKVLITKQLSIAYLCFPSHFND